MSEFNPSPEVKPPYDAALDDFFKMLVNNAAGETQLRSTLSGLLVVAAGNGVNAPLYVDNWSQRHAYDARGIIADGDLYADELPDCTDETDVLDKKLALLSDVSAFLIASKHSLLADAQKERLMYRVGAFFEERHSWRKLESVFGTAVAPYLAHDIDMIEMYSERGDFESDERKATIKRGRFVLRTVNRIPYMRNDIGHKLSRALRRARKN